MGLRIATNVSSLTSQRHLINTRRLLDRSLERLSSGYRINKAGDDAAGLAISEKLRAKTRGLIQAQRNASDGISLIQVAEGGLEEIQNILVRLRELGVQAASDTIGSQERRYLNEEYQSLKEEVDRIANVTEFNGTVLLDGTGGSLDFQVNTGGLNLLGVDRISFDAFKSDVNADKLGLEELSIDTKVNAQRSLSIIDGAIEDVSSIRGELGAIDNRLTSTIRNLSVSIENLTAANSRIKDVDVALETSELTRNNILMQAGTSVLQQANSIPKMALTLLQNT
ncbi:flagellin N-terminal helical domain-containing protein [Oligoflexus tunisiensis]|uniref:flagellin N-terminal helical domain-containing protein n=1 Tax=Oligoflexus tunisiensis TaxID=708132 RepID=UPI000AFD311D|nr:flagellin [Oligoflexus tunisiensis]